jgi:hypothetical protein
MKYDPAVQCLILEQHVNAVLAARKSGPEDLMRAAGMVRALWTELTPSRWAVLLRSIETHSYLRPSEPRWQRREPRRTCRSQPLFGRR